MALLNMYNNNSEHKPGHCPPMSPRISFSNDFVDTRQVLRQDRRLDAPPASTDFEFSVNNYSTMSGADELFSKGRLLPYRECGGSGSQGQRTIRDELLVDDDGEKASRRPPKSSTRWKGLLGLKRSHIGSKKVDKAAPDVGSMERVGDSRNTSGYVHEEVHGNKSSQEMFNEAGSSSCRDFEFGI